MAFDRQRCADLYPFASHWFDRGAGVRMHYLDEGPAELSTTADGPIVCVHGNPTWSFYFRAIVSAFRDTHRVIAPDHIGCGLSDKPGDDRYAYTLASRVDDLVALLDHLQLDAGLTLVVHDWGGLIGLTAALRQPRRIARLVVLNTAAFGLPAGQRLPWRLRIIRDNPRLGALLVQGFNAFARPATRMAVVRRLPADVRAGLVAPYDSSAHRIATLRFVQDIPLRPGDESWELLQWTQGRLDQLGSAPMLIVWGLRDFVFNRGFLDEWRRRFPAAEVHAFEDAGHYVLEDRPADVLRLMRAFLARTGSR